MKQILINVLYALLLVAVLCFCYFLVVYVLGQLGWTPPIILLRITFIGLALFAAILILTGRANKWLCILLICQLYQCDFSQIGMIT